MAHLPWVRAHELHQGHRVINLLPRHAGVPPVPQVVTDQVDGPRHRPPRRNGRCVGRPRWVASALVTAGLQPLQQRRLVLCILRAAVFAGTGRKLFLLVLAACQTYMVPTMQRVEGFTSGTVRACN